MKIFKFLTHFEHYFYIGKYTEKGQFSPYRAALKREYLELGIEFLHSVKSADFVLKFSFISAQHVFLARDPPLSPFMHIQQNIKIRYQNGYFGILKIGQKLKFGL